MKFTKSVLPLGEGRVSSAAFRGSTDIGFLICVNGAVVKKTYDTEKKVLSRAEKVSYADECFFIGDGFIERFGTKISCAP